MNRNNIIGTLLITVIIGLLGILIIQNHRPTLYEVVPEQMYSSFYSVTHMANEPEYRNDIKALGLKPLGIMISGKVTNVSTSRFILIPDAENLKPVVVKRDGLSDSAWRSISKADEVTVYAIDFGNGFIKPKMVTDKNIMFVCQ